MRSATIFSAAVAVGAGFVKAQTDDDCSKDFNITTSTPSISCKTIGGNVHVGSTVSGTLDLSGVKTIKGDLIVNNASQLLGLTSSSLTTIGGTFELSSLDLLATLEMENLDSVGQIYFERLQQLTSMTFGSMGVSKTENITITDTRLSTLEGLNIGTVGTFEVSNNPQLTNLQSKLVNVTDSLIFNTNGPSLTINMTSLQSAGIIELRQMSGFDAPALKTVGRLSFDTNPSLTSFTANNLTSVADSLTFINNVKLVNFSFPALTNIQGDLTVQNNTKLEVIQGLPQLKSVFGGITVGGGFKKVSLPKLTHVTGTVTAQTSTNSSDFCSYFDNLKSNGDISGKETCHYNNQNALTGGDGGESSDGSSGGSGSSSDKDDAAGIVSANLGLAALSAVAAVAYLF